MFGFGKKKKELVGLDIGSSSVKAVKLKRKGEGYELENLGLETFDPDTVVDGAIMNAPEVSRRINAIFSENKISTKNVATSVSGHSVIVKRITVAAATEEEVANAIPYEAQQYIPFDMADVNMGYQVLGPAATGNGLDVMLVAVKREKIQNYTTVLSVAGKAPLVVDIDAFAVQKGFEVNYEPPPDLMVALLNVGASIMNIHIVRGSVPLFTRDVPVGGNQYTDTLQKELDLSFEDAEKLKKGQEVPNVSLEAKAAHIRSVSDILLLEIQKTFDFFRQTASGENIQGIYVAGGTAKIEGLVDLLKEDFGIPVEIFDPFRKITVPNNIVPEMVREQGPRM